MTNEFLQVKPKSDFFSLNVDDKEREAKEIIVPAFLFTFEKPVNIEFL